jgi:hypothetical protein
VRHSEIPLELDALDLLGIPGDSAPEIREETLPDFPESAWRGPFRDYREAMTGTTEASDVAHFSALWAGTASALGRRVFMHAGDIVFPNVYLSVFGATGDKKTTAQRRILSYDLLPSSIRIIRNVGSTEGLADAWTRENADGGVALFFWEEFAQMVARGRWTGSTLLEFFTETFDCPPDWGTQYRKKPIHIVSPTPSILAGTTIEWFWKNARPEDFFGGFGNRFLFLTGPKKHPLPNPGKPNESLLRRIREALLQFSNMEPTEARFGTAAERLWERFYLDWEGRERGGLYAAVVKRIHVYIRKLAMVYAAFEGTLPEISVEQLKAAIAVGIFAGECARELVNVPHANALSDDELERMFLRWIAPHEGVRKRYMQQSLSKKTGGCDRFNRIVMNLQRADQIEIRENRVYLSR